MTSPQSQQVSWWTVHSFVQRFLDTTEHYPTCGTPAWAELADGDRRKWAALLEFAQHHALRREVAQEQQSEASKAIADSASWSSIAQEIRGRQDFYRERPWLKRVAG